MPDTFTPTLNLTKVGINESDDTWGQKLNENCDKIDAEAATTRAEVTALEARCTALEAEAAKASWVGEIRMHSGTLASIANIPGGVWKLCDGQEGRPNLIDKMILGAGGAIAVGATGGSASWAGKVASKALSGLKAVAKALTVGQMPRHGHTLTDPGHDHAAAGDSGSNAAFANRANVFLRPSDVGSPNYIGFGAIDVAPAATGITIAQAGNNEAHDHDLPDLSHDHDVGPVPTVPPYYALAFVIRTA